MAERAAALGGTLQARPGPGGGFGVQARLPLPPAAPAGPPPDQQPDEPQAERSNEPQAGR
jgi:hypothetical protein